MSNPYSSPAARSADTAGQVERSRRAVVWWGISSLLAFALVAAVAIFVVPAFGDLLSSFGADLPLPTRIVLQWSRLSLMLPAMAAVLLIDAMRRSALSTEYRHGIIWIFVGSIVLAVVLIVCAIYALYLPVFKMGQPA